MLHIMTTSACVLAFLPQPLLPKFLLMWNKTGTVSHDTPKETDLLAKETRKQPDNPPWQTQSCFLANALMSLGDDL
jgi:hypothetical protein